MPVTEDRVEFLLLNEPAQSFGKSAEFMLSHCPGFHEDAKAFRQVSYVEMDVLPVFMTGTADVGFQIP